MSTGPDPRRVVTNCLSHSEPTPTHRESGVVGLLGVPRTRGPGPVGPTGPLDLPLTRVSLRPQTSLGVPDTSVTCPVSEGHTYGPHPLFKRHIRTGTPYKGPGEWGFTLCPDE